MLAMMIWLGYWTLSDGLGYRTVRDGVSGSFRWRRDIRRGSSYSHVVRSFSPRILMVVNAWVHGLKTFTCKTPLFGMGASTYVIDVTDLECPPGGCVARWRPSSRQNGPQDLSSRSTKGISTGYDVTVTDPLAKKRLTSGP
jgi:hypothetical protein